VRRRSGPQVAQRYSRWARQTGRGFSSRWPRPERCLVVGLGLNVTLAPDELPAPTATSLLMLGSPVKDRNMLLSNIIRHLGAQVDRWRSAQGADAPRAVKLNGDSVTKVIDESSAFIGLPVNYLSGRSDSGNRPF
jgi:hypothetical protein